MKAIVNTIYGSPDVLELKEVAKPVPKEDEILVRVHATTVNRTDCAILRAKPFIMRFVTGLTKPKNSIQGTDFAGIIEAVGKDVKAFKVGDRVMGFNDEGLSSHCEYLTILENEGVVSIPENTSFEDAVASCEGVHYAVNTINKLKLKSGQKILVNGATGAIGSALVQLLKNRGIIVFAVGNLENIDLKKALGADIDIDYRKEDFTKLDIEFDGVFDTVGKSSFTKSKHLIKDGGIYISSELGWMAQNIFYSIFTPFLGTKKVIFPIPSDIKGSLVFIRELLEQGKFKPLIDRRYPLEKIADAYRYVESGEKMGNVIINVMTK